jgi:hypothetical protein
MSEVEKPTAISVADIAGITDSRRAEILAGLIRPDFLTVRFIESDIPAPLEYHFVPSNGYEPAA